MRRTEGWTRQRQNSLFCLFFSIALKNCKFEQNMTILARSRWYCLLDFRWSALTFYDFLQKNDTGIAIAETPAVIGNKVLEVMNKV